jgi:putative ABC transport system permease protein
MFKSYLKVAFRNAKKSRTFSMINITGLSIGMTVCLLMLMYVVNEMSFENFHQNKDNIYRIVLNWGTEESKMKFAGSMPAIAQAVEAQIPEIRKAIRIRRNYEAVLINSQNQPIKEESVFFADPGIFDIFSFQLYKGDKSHLKGTG